MQVPVIRAVVRLLFLVAVLAPMLTVCSEDEKPLDGDHPCGDTICHLVPSVVREIPHANYLVHEASTQGLLYYDGVLYESNGGASDIRKSNMRTIDPADGSIVKQVLLNNSAGGFAPCAPGFCFGEGIAMRGGRIVQILWVNFFTLGWSVPDLDYLGVEFAYAGQGWGLASDDTGFVMSDGSDTLYFRNDAFAVTYKLPVTLRGAPLDSLNELEYVKGVMYANVLGRDFIYGIDLKTGAVNSVIDGTSLVERVGLADLQHALNGIAYDGSTGLFYVTGKDWPYIFEVLFVENR
jgi:glutamine cyclotransferase